MWVFSQILAVFYQDSHGLQRGQFKGKLGVHSWPAAARGSALSCGSLAWGQNICRNYCYQVGQHNISRKGFLTDWNQVLDFIKQDFSAFLSSLNFEEPLQEFLNPVDQSLRKLSDQEF